VIPERIIFASRGITVFSQQIYLMIFLDLLQNLHLFLHKTPCISKCYLFWLLKYSPYTQKLCQNLNVQLQGQRAKGIGQGLWEQGAEKDIRTYVGWGSKGLEKTLNEEHYGLYSAPHIFWVTKQEAICLNGKIILKWITDCIHAAEDRNKRQAVLNTVTNLRFDKIRGIARLP